MDSNFKEMRVGGHHGALIILLCSFGLKQCGNTKITITNFLPESMSNVTFHAIPIKTFAPWQV